MTTRRVSGASSASNNGMGPMIEAYDAFKKKHMQQNKEIIHKNSVLSKSNSELERTVTSLRAERLALKGSLFHLECENSNLRTRLQQTESQLNEAREAASAGISPWDREQLQMTQRLYLNALAALQALGAGLPTCSSPMSDEASDVPSSPPPIPTSTILHSRLSTVTGSSKSHYGFVFRRSQTDPSSEILQIESPPTPSASSSSSSSGDLNRNVTVSRRGSNAGRVPRPSSIILQRNPDLSHISEGAEQSHFNDDEEDDSDDETPMQSAWKGTVLDGLREEPRALASPSVSRPPTPIFVPPPTPSPLSAPLSTLSETTSTTTSTSALSARPAPSKARSTNSAPPAARSAHANTSSFSQQKPARRVSGIVKAPTPEPQPGQLGSVKSDATAGTTATATGTGTGAAGKRTSIVGQLGRKSVSASTLTTTTSSASSNGGKKAIEDDDDYWNERKTLLKLESLGPKEMLAIVGSRRRTSTLAAAESKISSASERNKDTSTTSSTSEDEQRVGESISTQLVTQHKRYEDEESSNEVDEQSSDEEFVPSKKLVEAALAKARGKRRATRAGEQEVEQEQEREFDYEQDSNFGSAPVSSASQPRSMPSSSAPPVLQVLQSNMILANGGNEEGDAGGRRARKSVNYALPKLNTKMRRPENYVPVTNSHPRKSSRPSVASASGGTSHILRTKSSLTSLRSRASIANSENETMSDLDEEDSLPSRNEKDGGLKGNHGGGGGGVTARRHTLMA